MKSNLIYAAILILIVIGIVIEISFWYTIRTSQLTNTSQPASTNPAASVSLAPEVELILARKIKLIKELVKDPAIIDEVKKTNEAHRAILPSDIANLDALWVNSPAADPIFKPFLTNQAALKLIDFQELNLGFSEIFITDMRGLNIAVTNETTDYYQADEDWWVKSYNNGQGKESHGPIEFDQSAQIEGISLYVPIKDPQTQKTIGVTKAVLTISAIKFEL